MKIGMIRRIDNLGRIVIPKEIRDKLRIKTSDSLEINLEDESITIKKYSELNNILEIEKIIASIIKETQNVEVLITDKDKYIIGTKTNYINNKITDKLINIMENRKAVIQKNNEEEILINPIIIKGDIIGSILIFSKTKINDDIIKTVELLTNFLIKYIE